MTSGTTADIAAPTAIEAPHERADPERQRAERERAALRRRRRAMVWGLPFSLVALLVAAKLISMVLVGQATVAKYEDADYEGALNSAQQQKILNVIEQWKAPYSTGTTYLQLGLNDEARAELESALPLAGGIDQCPVRSNLAIAIERQGDAMLDAGDSEGARDHWTQALAVLEQQPRNARSRRRRRRWTSRSSASGRNSTRRRRTPRRSPRRRRRPSRRTSSRTNWRRTSRTVRT